MELPPIDEKMVDAAQKEWCDGLLKISLAFREHRDYTTVASNFIDDMYDFAEGGRVFFRPTLAVAPDAFRIDKPGALSYFIAGNPERYPHDEGFALKPFIEATHDNAIGGTNAIQIYGEIAMTMGNVHLKELDGTRTMVDKVFVFRRCSDQKLRLIVHKSALSNV